MTGFGLRKIMIGCVEVRQVFGKQFAGKPSEAETGIRNGSRAITNNFESCGFEKRHWEIAGKINPFGIESNIHRESLNQVFTVFAVVKCACTEEQSQGRINGRFVSAVPKSTKPRTAESESISARPRKQH